MKRMDAGHICWWTRIINKVLFCSVVLFTTRPLGAHLRQVSKKSDQWSRRRCDNEKRFTDGWTTMVHYGWEHSRTQGVVHIMTVLDSLHIKNPYLSNRWPLTSPTVGLPMSDCTDSCIWATSSLPRKPVFGGFQLCKTQTYLLLS